MTKVTGLMDHVVVDICIKEVVIHCDRFGLEGSSASTGIN